MNLEFSHKYYMISCLSLKRSIITSIKTFHCNLRLICTITQFICSQTIPSPLMKSFFCHNCIKTEIKNIIVHFEVLEILIRLITKIIPKYE